jgi:hypothetical protein
MTPFEQALEQIKNGNLKTPKVTNGGTEVDYIGYQLSVHKFQLKILSSGMTMRGVKLKSIKDYYGFKGKTAKECLPQMEDLISKFFNQQIVSI